MADKNREMRIDITARDKTKAAIGSARRGFNSMAKGLGVVGAAIGGLGLGLMVKQTLEAADAHVKFADRIGASAKGLRGLQHAGELTGVATSALNMGLQRMTRRVAEAAQGTGEAVKALDELNISAQDLSQLAPEEQFKVISEAMEGVESQSDRVRLAFKLFDSEGVALVNTLALGSEELNRLSKEADDLGISLDRAELAKIEAANDAMLRVTSVIQGVANTLTVQFAPLLTALANDFSEASKEAGGFGDVIKSGSETALVGIARVGDAWHGWRMIIAGLEVAITGFGAFYWGVLDGMDGGLRAVLNTSIGLLNEFIEKVNMIPGVSVPLVSRVADSSSGLSGIVNTANTLLDEATDKLLALADQPLPSENIKAWIEEVKIAADQAAQDIAQKAAERTGGGVEAPAGGTGAVLTDEQLEKNLAALNSQFLLEREAIQIEYEEREALLQEALDRNLIHETDHRLAVAEIESDFQSQLTAVAKAEADKRQQISDLEFTRRVGAVRNMTSAITNINKAFSKQGAEQSKKDFDRNQRVGVATTLVNTAVAAVDAARNTPGAWWSKLAAIAAVVAGGMAQVSAIKAQKWSGGSGSLPTGGGGAGSNITQPVITQPASEVLQPDPASQVRADRSIRVTIMGNVYSEDDLARSLLPALKKAEEDDVEALTIT